MHGSSGTACWAHDKLQMVAARSPAGVAAALPLSCQLRSLAKTKAERLRLQGNNVTLTPENAACHNNGVGSAWAAQRVQV